MLKLLNHTNQPGVFSSGVKPTSAEGVRTAADLVNRCLAAALKLLDYQRKQRNPGDKRANERIEARP